MSVLSGLDSRQRSVKIWDPAIGTGLSSFVLAHSLESAGYCVTLRGQDIDRKAVESSRDRLSSLADQEIACCNTLVHDQYPDFAPDIIVAGLPWSILRNAYEDDILKRQSQGAFQFGLPSRMDSEWLFISLALEKLRLPEDGGGRVAALVPAGPLFRANTGTAEVRRRIVESGMLESVVRLPDGLHPGIGLTPYLLTFTNLPKKQRRNKIHVFDFRSQFTVARQQRSLTSSALEELESGLRTWKQGPRNRVAATSQFTVHTGRVRHLLDDGSELTWPVETYNNRPLNEKFLADRYSTEVNLRITDDVATSVRLEPSHIFGDGEARDITASISAHGWAVGRLSAVLTRLPVRDDKGDEQRGDSTIWVPTTREGRVSTHPADAATAGRVLAVSIDGSLIERDFLVAWLNSERGVASRQRALVAGSSGDHIRAVRSDPGSLMRWADQLIVPIPPLGTQSALAAADEQLRSFEAQVESMRASIWNNPSDVDDTVSTIKTAFDDSLTSWMDGLPFPIASALWTAHTARSPESQQRAYFNAWEAIVVFHAAVLLSAAREDGQRSRELESAIAEALKNAGNSITNASIGTWVVIVEKLSKEFRTALTSKEPHDSVRLRRMFSDLPATAIERLVDLEIVKKFQEVRSKRNRWKGHSGHTSDATFQEQVSSLVSDLRELQRLYGNVWRQFRLVRVGAGRKRGSGITHEVEDVVGRSIPFETSTVVVDEMLNDDELYLAYKGSRSALRLCKLVCLKASPESAHYTTYFYNRTDGKEVHLVSYQHGSDADFSEAFSSLERDLGALI